MSIVWPVDRLAHTASIKTISSGCTGFLVRAQCCAPAKTKKTAFVVHRILLSTKYNTAIAKVNPGWFYTFLYLGIVAGSTSHGLIQ